MADLPLSVGPFPARSTMPHGISRRFDCCMWLVLTKHLQAKYGKGVQEYVKADVAVSPRASWLYELADPQLTAVCAES